MRRKVPKPPPEGPPRLKALVDSVERSLIVEALERAHHNLAEAARRLGISRRALYYRMERLGLERARL